MSDSRHRVAAAQPNRGSASQIENEQESESGIVLLLPRRIRNFLLKLFRRRILLWNFLQKYHLLEVKYLSQVTFSDLFHCSCSYTRL